MRVANDANLGNFSPKYVDVATSLMEDISAGRYKVGDCLPSQNELAKRFGITPMTARKALGVLKDRKIAKASSGRGTFVASSRIDDDEIQTSVRVGYVRSATNAASDTIYVQIMSGAFSALHSREIEVVYFDDTEIEASSLETLVDFASRVDGLIVPGTLDTVVLQKLLSLQVRFVAIQVKPELDRVPYVGPDYTTAAYMATQHLIELGHTRIGTVGYFPQFIHTRQFRQGYEQALADHGVARLPQFELWEHDDLAGGYFSVKKMFSNPDDRPTGVVCMTEHKARIAVRYLASIGLRVPQDVSVIGQYDGFESISEPPHLTTMRQEPAEIGRQAAEVLLGIIRGENGLSIARKELKPTLIQRDTTAACSSSQLAVDANI